MAEANPVVTPPSVPPGSPAPPAAPPVAPPEPDVYRPVSPLAVAGLCLGGLYAGLVLTTTIVAVVKGTPFFLPSWVIVFAVAGAVVSYVGLRQIASSEGTRAGTPLARAGLWLSIVFGLGYTAYAYFTGLALTQQADHFLTVASEEDSGFFARLATGQPEEINRAFLMTLPYSRRAGFRPSDIGRLIKEFDVSGTIGGEEGELSRFREHPVVRIILGANKDVTIEPLGVREWIYEQGSYKVTRDYRISAPEAVMDVSAQVVSTEGEDSEGRRKWFVSLPRLIPTNLRPTALGQAMEATRLLGRNAAERWTEKMKTGKFELPDATKYDKLVPPGMSPDLLKERIGELMAGGSTHIRGTIQASPEDRFTPSKKLPDGRLQIVRELGAHADFVKGLEQFRAKIFVYLETKTPYDPMHPGPILPEWDVTKFEVVRISLLKGPSMTAQPPSLKGLP